MNNKIYIDIAENLGEVYWLGLKYFVECSFNRFYGVRDLYDNEVTDYVLEGNILNKFFKMGATAKGN